MLASVFRVVRIWVGDMQRSIEVAILISANYRVSAFGSVVVAIKNLVLDRGAAKRDAVRRDRVPVLEQGQRPRGPGDENCGFR